MQLNDATAIITGAGRGLGLAFTRAILSKGGRVLMTDIDSTVLKAAGDALNAEFPGRVHYQRQDVCDLSSFDAAFDTANRVFHPHKANVLINNAGISVPAFYSDVANPSAWLKVMEINLTAVMRGTQVYPSDATSLPLYRSH